MISTHRPGRWRRVLTWTTVPLALVIATCWWFTEPFKTPDQDEGQLAAKPTPETPGPSAAETVSSWPETPLEGVPAKRLLLASLESAKRRLDRVEGYTATFRRQERLKGKLGPEQTLQMKARPEPFAIYFKFLSPKAGKEVVFAKGKHDDKLIAHNGDWKDKLIPRLKLDPAGSIALADCRHPITEAGLFNLTDRLIGYRRMDLEEADAETVLDRTSDPEGREWYRSVHTHKDPKAGRPFARVEVLYDPETRLPRRITSFDWPEPGRPDGPLQVAERYCYDDLDLDAALSELDFDPANPAYAFSRF